MSNIDILYKYVFVYTYIYGYILYKYTVIFYVYMQKYICLPKRYIPKRC